VKGQFSGVSGTLSFDEQDVANSKVEVNIPVATINGGWTSSTNGSKVLANDVRILAGSPELGTAGRDSVGF
jgi:translation initiation factor 6 (eIF-6)